MKCRASTRPSIALVLAAFLAPLLAPGVAAAEAGIVPNPEPGIVSNTEPDTVPNAEAGTVPNAETGVGATGVVRNRVVQEGIAVDMEIEAIGDHPDAGLREGDPVIVRFAITDTNTGEPMSALFPAAWMDKVPPNPEDDDTCQDKVEAFIGGSLLAQSEVDLNVYYVLAMNDDASISVVDPLFGFGNSKLLEMAVLEAPGEDWALTRDQRRLFVSMPDVGKVAVVDTATWDVTENIEVGAHPARTVLQPDEEYLWVAWRDASDSGAEPSGVAVIDLDEERVVKRIVTGRGGHDVEVDADGRYAFVSNSVEDTLTVIDVSTLEVVKTIETGEEPVDIAYSPVGRAVYVSHRAGGVVAAVDAVSHEVVARMETSPGLSRIRFAPDGRLGFVVNPKTDELHIIDAASQQIVQTGDMEDGPQDVGFTRELAYVRHADSEIVLMIPLQEVGRPGEPVPVVDFPGGQNPPGRMTRPTPAAGIVEAPGATAVLVANPYDESIYYYKEGMAAPMGHFKNYDRRPRAVTVIDRSLQEIEPGVYETAVELRRPGAYDLAFFLDSPRMFHCFDFAVEENPVLAGERAAARQGAKVSYQLEGNRFDVGEEMAVRFRLTDTVSREPVTGAGDVQVLTFLAPGTWQKRHVAEEVEPGIYEIRFAPPQRGVYYVFVQSGSLGLAFRQSGYVTFMAGDLTVEESS